MSKNPYTMLEKIKKYLFRYALVFLHLNFIIVKEKEICIKGKGEIEMVWMMVDFFLC